MGALTWLKVLLPILLEYGKEVFVPGTDEKRTNTLERLSLLIIVGQFCMIVFVGEQFFTLHGENVKLKTTVSHMEETALLQRMRIDNLIEMRHDTREERVIPPPTPAPKTYDKHDSVSGKERHVRSANDSDQTRMMDWINGT